MLVLRVYHGMRRPGGKAVVTADNQPLAPRLDLRHHSDEGFEWGYGEGGPAQLALALLCDFLQDDAKALELYRNFKRRVVWRLPAGAWTLTGAEIQQALEEIRAQTARERLKDLLGVVIKAACFRCGRRRTFWAHDRESMLRHLDEEEWVEFLAEDGEVHFKCPDCSRP